MSDNTPEDPACNAPADDAPTVTQLLNEARAGDKTALDRLFPLVYGELRRLADSCLRRERPDHTLQPTALVHEAYLRLRAQNLPDLQDRSHFMKLAVRVMRQILVDHARRRNVRKRSAAMQVSLAETGTGTGAAAVAASSERPHCMIELDDALKALEKRDDRKARLIEMRYFGGLTADESASVLQMEVRDVRRELRLAQAWLGRELARRNIAAGREPSR